ncbi:MAG: CPBP family intramembrane glutamic endopeptidase [Candidatus Izemoplasmataceae bacterium]
MLDGRGVIALPFPGELLGIIGAFGPSAVGLWFLVRHMKRSFKSVIKETFFYRGDIRTAFLTFALMPGILGISYLITRFLFGVEYALEWFEAPWMIPVVFLYILFLGGPLGEEIGWRGYALPGLLRKYNPFVASLILGLVWTFWHVPAFFIPDSAQEGISFPLYLVNTMILTMILTVLYLRTKRISSALYFHTSANFALGIFYIIDQTSALVFIGIFMVLTLLTLLYKERARMFKRPAPL